MTQAQTITAMTAESMNPHAIVGWVVREGIMRQGMKYTEAARKWPMSLPTLNRMMAGQPVGLMFYRVAERELGLPWHLFDHVLNGDVDSVRDADLTAGFDVSLKADILREMSPGGSPPPQGTRRRRA